MTQDQRIDKTIEIAARIYGDILGNVAKDSTRNTFGDVGRISVHVAMAIISEAEREGTK